MFSLDFQYKKPFVFLPYERSENQKQPSNKEEELPEEINPIIQYYRDFFSSKFTESELEPFMVTVRDVIFFLHDNSVYFYQIVDLFWSPYIGDCLFQSLTLFPVPECIIQVLDLMAYLMNKKKIFDFYREYPLLEVACNIYINSGNNQQLREQSLCMISKALMLMHEINPEILKMLFLSFKDAIKISQLCEINVCRFLLNFVCNYDFEQCINNILRLFYDILAQDCTNKSIRKICKALNYIMQSNLNSFIKIQDQLIISILMRHLYEEANFKSDLGYVVYFLEFCEQVLRKFDNVNRIERFMQTVRSNWLEKMYHNDSNDAIRPLIIRIFNHLVKREENRGCKISYIPEICHFFNEVTKKFNSKNYGTKREIILFVNRFLKTGITNVYRRCIEKSGKFFGSFSVFAFDSNDNFIVEKQIESILIVLTAAVRLNETTVFLECFFKANIFKAIFDFQVDEEESISNLARALVCQVEGLQNSG